MIERIDLILRVDVKEMNCVGFGWILVTSRSLINHSIGRFGWITKWLHRFEEIWRYVDCGAVVTIVVDSVTVVVSIVTCCHRNSQESGHQHQHLPYQSHKSNNTILKFLQHWLLAKELNGRWIEGTHFEYGWELITWILSKWCCVYQWIGHGRKWITQDVDCWTGNWWLVLVDSKDRLNAHSNGWWKAARPHSPFSKPIRNKFTLFVRKKKVGVDFAAWPWPNEK